MNSILQRKCLSSSPRRFLFVSNGKNSSQARTEHRFNVHRCSYSNHSLRRGDRKETPRSRYGRSHQCPSFSSPTATVNTEFQRSSVRIASHHRPLSSSSASSSSSSSSSSQQSPPSTLEALEELVRSGDLKPDRSQKQVANKLARLQRALVDYDNSVLFGPREEASPDSDEIHDKKTGNDGVTANDRTSTQGDATGRRGEDVEAARAATDERERERSDAGRDDDDEGANAHEAAPPMLRIPRGLYIHGKVGTGKTMLMDFFYESAVVAGGDDTRKRRLHFHEFLAAIHADVHDLKQRDLAEKGRNFSVDTSLSNNPIHRVALKVASEVSLLCLDEFQVTDIADALILSQLFSVLFRKGTVVVATSNRPPSDLYEGGLNRSYFLPFIDLLERHCITHHIPSQKDYRAILSNGSSPFFLKQQQQQQQQQPVGEHRREPTVVENLVASLARELVAVGENDDDGEGGGTAPKPLSVDLPAGFNRSIRVEELYGTVGARSGRGRGGGKEDDRGDNGKERPPPNMAVFSFEELCDADRGSGDYKAVAEAFDVVVLKDVPTMDLEGHNLARRFITLIDELYEGKCALVLSARTATTPNGLFRWTFADADAYANRTDASEEADPEAGIGRDSSRGDPEDAQQQQRQEVASGDESEVVMGIDVAQEGGTPVGALASVRELSFAFRRSSSRIVEMCSRSWWDKILGS